MSRKVGTSWKRQREQESQVPAERQLSRRAGRTGQVGTGRNGRLSWSGRCRAERQEEQGRWMPAGSGRKSRES